MNSSYKKAMDKIVLSDELKEKIINKALIKQPKKPFLKSSAVAGRRIAALAVCFMVCLLSYYGVTNSYEPKPANIVAVNPPYSAPSNPDSEKNTAVNIPAKEQLTLNSKTVDAPGIGKQAASKPAAGDTAKANDNQPETDSETRETPAVESLPAAKDVPSFAKGKVATKETDTAANNPRTVEEIAAILGYEIQYPQKMPAGYAVSAMSVTDGYIAEITYQGEQGHITYRTAKASADVSPENALYTFMEIVNIHNTDVVLKGNENLYYNAVWLTDTETFSVISDTGVEKSVMADIVSSVGYANENKF